MKTERKQFKTCCYHCGRTIKGEGICYAPPMLTIRLGVDDLKWYHPACYRKVEGRIM